MPVSFCVGSAGAAERVAVTSSGLVLLDEAVERCVLSRAAPFPSGASGHCFMVSVEFSGAR
ncbi:MAG: hypothetical protein JNJ54_19985 [Myxococcaceae bacterium]|nr:hypothetical protein [Myxococcaceae bacterium]